MITCNNRMVTTLIGEEVASAVRTGRDTREQRKRIDYGSI